MKELRFALIGCGRIAKNHLGPLTEIQGAKLVAVCDLIPERAEGYAQKYNVLAYTNYHIMLKKENIDVVCILTPSGIHPQHTIDVIKRYKKHVVVEKPMALAWDDLAKMKSTAEANGVKIFPVYQNRYNKAVQKVRDDLLTGALGKPVLGTVRLRWCRPQTYYNRDAWRGTWAMDGGALTNQGIHYIDLLQYMLGDIESVTARAATQLVDVEVEDTFVATLKFKNGALGVIEVTTAARPDDFEASISVLAEKGTAILTGIASNQLSTYTLDPQHANNYSEDFPDAYGFGHWNFFRDVVADLQDKKPHPVSFEEGTRAIRLLNALYRSAEDNREVFLDEGVASNKLGKPDEKLAKLYITEAE
ncbi:MAG: Gfo/Idh/MocA family oxidoreductase [Anaerolineales bacterium]|nr:Gfo/Idh/MocA family oxidoreductase [Anaerolineales bacterium]MBX3036819.1 Gfo/Idh/MocA family oxidoreductase [Anaerolineales bacterium]